MKQTMSLSEFSCQSEYTRLYPNITRLCVVCTADDIVMIHKIHEAILILTLISPAINLLKCRLTVIFCIYLLTLFLTCKYCDKQCKSRSDMIWVHTVGQKATKISTDDEKQTTCFKT